MRFQLVDPSYCVTTDLTYHKHAFEGFVRFHVSINVTASMKAFVRFIPMFQLMSTAITSKLKMNLHKSSLTYL